MSLDADWIVDTVELLSSVVTIQHHTSTPLTGTRSLRMNITNGATVGAKGAGAVFLNDEVYERGLNLGRIRTLMRIDSTLNHAGIFFMGSESEGITDTGACYTFGPVGSSHTLTLRKLVTDGLIDAAPETLFESDYTFDDLTDTFAIDVEWKSDVDVFGGTHITMKVGTEINFSSMETLGIYVDESSPFILGINEGIFCYKTGTSAVGQVIFDNTTVYKLEEAA